METNLKQFYNEKEHLENNGFVGSSQYYIICKKISELESNLTNLVEGK